MPQKPSLEEFIKLRIQDEKFDEVTFMNDPMISSNLEEACRIVTQMLNFHRIEFKKLRNDFTFSMTLEKVNQLGGMVERLEKRLANNIKILNQSEVVRQNSVIECDQAKAKIDHLIEIVKAKITWKNTFDELKLLEDFSTSAADQKLRFQKLVLLQQSYSLISQYTSNNPDFLEFEKQKDRFLAWHSSAAVVAIDSNDTNQLASIRDKFFALDRLKVFESVFAAYAENKIKLFVDDAKCDSIWTLLREVFDIWKRCHRLSSNYSESNNSENFANCLNEGLNTKWDKVKELVLQLQINLDTPIDAVRELGKIRQEITDFAVNEGDEHIYRLLNDVCQKLFSLLSEDYGKHVTSEILCTINKITTPEKTSRFRQKWIFPFLEQIQSCMRNAVTDARQMFGSNFTTYVIPALETGIKELYSLLLNQDIFNLDTANPDVRARKSVQENTEDKISAILVSGYLLNIVDDINSCIAKELAESANISASEGVNDVGEERQCISNRHLLVALNKRVVDRKIESIAYTNIYQMEEEIQKLKHAELTSQISREENTDALKLSLPSFSVSPHNYITTVGHGLLSQMNQISSYANDNNFVQAITTAAGFKCEEPDLWVLSEVGKQIQNAFSTSVGSITLLTPNLIRQFNADIGFLIEALVDLRLQPTPQISALAEKLKLANLS